jgi:hypothetical protein
MYQICCIAAAVKKALQTKSAISYTPLEYEGIIEFQFLPEKKRFATDNHRAENVTTWYGHCVDKGLQDMKILAPIAVQDRSLLGFSNTTQSCLVCFYEGKVTYFTSQWKFDSAQKLWNTLYTEHEWQDAPSEKPHFDNNTECFKVILANITELAYKIECDNFALIFQRAFDILSGSDSIEAAYCMPLPEIPNENLLLFKAASTADVFGAMGSWNDSPPYMAHEKGLDKEFETLSSELLTQVRLAILYAINEW